MKLPGRTTRASTARPESGQTIAIVAVAMIGVLIMAALAIDLTTLYVAHGEVQRAADAAALAGAKAFVDSGITTSPANPALQTLAQTLAVDYAKGAAQQNNVAGAPATFVNAVVNLTISPPGQPALDGDPSITVTLRRTGLPLFFARILGNSVASVSATAIAEAYNPAYSQTNTTGTIPPAPKCVKPFLVPNADQNQGGVPFVDTTTGAIKPAPLPFIGETITLTADCGAVQGACTPSGPPWANKYLPMFLPDTHRYCPACAGVGNFERSTECCDGTTFDYQQCGVSGVIGKWDPNVNPGGTGGPAQTGLQCLIHAPGPGPRPQPDSLNISQANNGPLQIQAGTYSQSRYGVPQGSVISTSDSIITVPLFDVNTFNPAAANQPVTIVGFLQLFVKYTGPGATDMNAIILNVVGCGNSLSANSPISGGGASAIPVRLIH